MLKYPVRNLLNNNKSFFIPYLIFLITSAFIVINYSKAEIHLYVNQFNSPFFDSFFTYWTYLGDGVVNLIIFLFLLFISFRSSLTLGIASLGTGAIIQILKRLVFEGTFRPVRYFSDTPHKLHLVENIDMSMYFSFPSGHTAAAFTTFLCLALFLNPKKKSLKFIAFVIALSVGFSRIYLSQHFFIDVIYGSIIGSITAIISYMVFNKIENPKLDKSIQELVFKRQ